MTNISIKRLLAHEYTHCISCKEKFSSKNVHTRDGMAETQISGMCEDCFDECTKEPDEKYGADADPTPYCLHCGPKSACDCGPRARNE